MLVGTASGDLGVVLTRIWVHPWARVLGLVSIPHLWPCTGFGDYGFWDRCFCCFGFWFGAVLRQVLTDQSFRGILTLVVEVQIGDP